VRPFLFLIFIVVMGSMFTGIASPTDAAALGCLATVILALAYRALRFMTLVACLKGTAVVTTMIFFIIAASTSFAQILAFSGATDGALAALAKIGGVLGLLALGGYEALRLFRGDQPWRVGWRPAARRLTRMGLTFSIVFLLLLGFMDRVWVGYSNPLEHLHRIVSYGAILRRPAGPSDIESYPWQWLWNDTQFPYAMLERQVRAGDEVRESRALVLFRGGMNPFVLQLWPLGLAFAGYVWWRRRPEAALGALALAWFAATYGPLCAAALVGQRMSYIHYFLPALPAVALSGSCFLLRAGLPRLVLWVYVAAVLFGFYGYFPFQASPAFPLKLIA
jgi:hypothetical protein